MKNKINTSESNPKMPVGFWMPVPAEDFGRDARPIPGHGEPSEYFLTGFQLCDSAEHTED